jgi:hypothetical protein
MSGILETLKFLGSSWLEVAVAVDERLETQAARIAELEEIVKSAFTEGFYCGREEGKELGEFAGNGGDHRRYEYARDSIWYWERSETETALKGGKKE